jgi:UDP-glucose 4-epimerase
VPTNPYGSTKIAFEEALRWYHRAYGLGYISLRYFNAAGADAAAGLGEDHDPETHLIPLVLQAAIDPDRTLRIHGTDYPTRDGTCVRDYIHVVDLAEAHVRAAERLAGDPVGAIYNLGTGEGTTVREIVDMARQVTGRDIHATEGPRRAGDPAVLIASRDRAGRELGWNAGRTLREILESAWEWHRTHPAGFR